MNATAPTLWQRVWYTRLRDAVRGRFDASLDWRRIVADAELPADIADAVGSVVRRTRLWKREKVDVARELVAHFQDGLEQGHAPAALLASFGDQSQTAALIRRAKKRGRSLVWHIWHYGWISVAALVAAYVATGLYMMTGRPSIKVDYLAFANDRAASVSESDRAWPQYREALLALGVEFNGDVITGNVTIEDARPGNADWPKIENFLQDHADAIAKLRAAAAQRELGFVTATSFAAFTPDDRKLFGVSVSDEDVKAFQSQTVENHWVISTLLPDLQKLRTSAWLLAADARRAAAAGEADVAMADTLGLVGISRHCQEKPFLINTVMALNVQKIACGVIRDTLADHPQLWSNGQLRDLAHKFAVVNVDWRRGFEGETAGFRDTMQRFYTDNGHGDGRLAFRTSSIDLNVFAMLSSFTSSDGQGSSAFLSNDGVAMLLLPAANMVVASRKDMTDMHERFMNYAIVQIGKPLWKQQDLVPPDEEQLSDQAGMIDRYRYLFLRIMLPAFEKLRATIATVDGERDGVLVGLALELFHREHHDWPKSLDELSPRWLPSVPVDRITGDPLHYKIVDHRPVVYSVGVDKDDDGGRLVKSLKGELHPEYAAPNYFDRNHEAVRESECDGDWVIWSTVKAQEPAAESE